MVVANILRCGVLPRYGCILSNSHFPSLFHGYKLSVVPTARKRVSLFPSLCTNVDPTSAVASPSSVAPELATSAGPKEECTLSSGDPIKDAANLLDIRVGYILKAWKHADAEALYVEEVDVGEAEPRIICSGLVKYIPLEHLQGKKVVVLANLKPRNMRGIKSNGMLLAASDASHENVELLEPSEGSITGERIWFGTEDEKANQPDAVSPNQIQKKKIWELVQPHLKTDAACMAALGGHYMRTTTGFVACQSLKNASIA